MQKMIMALVLANTALLWVSCTQQEDSTSTDENAPAVFFPLANFMDQEVRRLDSLGVTMTKTIRYNDSVEVQSGQAVDFEDELSIFRRADINKPAWTDQYQADTVFQGAQAREVRYQALEPDLEVRLLTVKWNALGDVTEIQARRANSSALASNEYELFYFPASGYRIKTQQENRAADPIEILIEGEFEE